MFYEFLCNVSCIFSSKFNNDINYRTVKICLLKEETGDKEKNWLKEKNVLTSGRKCKKEKAYDLFKEKVLNCWRTTDEEECIT